MNKRALGRRRKRSTFRPKHGWMHLVSQLYRNWGGKRW